MNSKRSLYLLLIILLCALSANAQTADTRFNKDGLVFDYPPGWKLEDSSDADAQQLVLGKGDIDVQIKVFVFRTPVNTPQRFAEAKRVLVDSYVNSTAKQLEQMGAKPERVTASADIANVKAEGVKIQVVFDGQGGAAEIYWGTLGQRLVVLTFFGPDKARQRAAVAWDKIRNSLQIEPPKPAEQSKPVEKTKSE
jgi:hypothetical protein